MANLAVEKANEVIKKHKTNNPEEILKILKVEVLDLPLAGRLKEMYFEDHVVLKSDLSNQERRQLLAHALCHHLYHAGNHLTIKNRMYSYGNYHEKQADVFAAYLLMPEEEFEKIIDEEITIYDLAERFDVLPYFVKFRMGLAKHYNPKKYSCLWS